MIMEYVKLIDICETITKGTTPTSVGFNFENNGINFVKIESIDDNGLFHLDKFAYINEECNRKLKRSQLKEKDILFSIAGAIGRVAVVNKNILPANTNQALAIIRLKDIKLNIRYLTLVLKSNYVVKQYQTMKQGVAQINLSLKNIGDFIIPLPSLEEQTQIVEELDTIEDLISKRKQQLEELDLLIKSRFNEMFENKAFREIKIADISELVTKGTTPTSVGFEFQSNGVNFVKIESIDNEGNFISNKFAYIDIECNEKLKRSQLKDKDILFSIAGAIGRVAIVDKSILPANTNQALAIIRFINGRVNVQYIKYALLSKRTNRQWNKLKQGVAQLNLSLKDISNFSIIYPPLELQNQFADFVTEVEKMKDSVKASIEKLETLKAKQMQKYFG